MPEHHYGVSYSHLSHSMSTAPSSLDVRSLSQEVIDGWPGAGRRHPPRTDPMYLLFRPLADQIRGQMNLHFGRRRDLKVLDVGCEAKPFFPLIGPWAETDRGRTVLP